MQLVRGIDLPKPLQDEVLRNFTYRWTVENIEKHPSIQPTDNFIVPTDEQWLILHAFWVTQKGCIARNRYYAESASLIKERKS